MDKAMLGFAMLLEAGSSAVPDPDSQPLDNEFTKSAALSTLSIGWALKTSSTRRSRFSTQQKEYLTQLVFKIGESTGRKADPTNVAKAMGSARNDAGERLFSRDDFLTSQQIANFFSRLAAKKRLDTSEEADFEEDESMAAKEALQAMRSQVVDEVALQHPTVFERHNICDLSSRQKRGKFSVKMLLEICKHFDLDTSKVTPRYKKPYIELLDSMVMICLYHSC